MINRLGGEQSFTSKIRISTTSAKKLTDFCNFAKGNNLENLDGNFHKNLLRQIKRLENNGNDDIVIIDLNDWDNLNLRVVEQSGKNLKLGIAQKNLFDYVEHKPLSLGRLYRQAKINTFEVPANSFNKYI